MEGPQTTPFLNLPHPSYPRPAMLCDDSSQPGVIIASSARFGQHSSLQRLSLLRCGIHILSSDSAVHVSFSPLTCCVPPSQYFLPFAVTVPFYPSSLHFSTWLMTRVSHARWELYAFFFSLSPFDARCLCMDLALWKQRLALRLRLHQIVPPR